MWTDGTIHSPILLEPELIQVVILKFPQLKPFVINATGLAEGLIRILLFWERKARGLRDAFPSLAPVLGCLRKPRAIERP